MNGDSSENPIQIISIPLPLGGYSEGFPIDKQQSGTSAHMSNVRPRDVLDKKIRLGKRPGLKKAYSQQIGGASFPIIELLSVTTIT